MLLDELLSRRLVVLSGKGGVGKSVVAAALALAARSRGRRVLLADVAAPQETAGLWGRRAAAGEETEVLPGLFTVNLDPPRVMDEYVRHVVRLDLVSRRILESPIYQRFLAVAPGLRELIVLGKIMVLEEERARFSRRPAWDLIVVDAPATGHGLAFLEVPQAAAAAVPVGPVGHNARRVLALLRDVERTALVVVAIPEEMAVAEALHFERTARERLRMPPQALVLNACHERRFTPQEEAAVLRLSASGEDGSLSDGVPIEAALRAARRQIRRRKLTTFYQGRLRRALDLPLVSLPYLFRERLEMDDLRLLAARLEAA